MRARDLGIAIGDGTPGANNAITDAGLERFVTMKEAASLQLLRLRDCKLTDDGIELLEFEALRIDAAYRLLVSHDFGRVDLGDVENISWRHGSNFLLRRLHGPY